MKTSAFEYDNIADKIFLPIYDVITDDIIKYTNITTGKVLDIGCGGGHLGLTLLKKGDFQADLCDINEEALSIASKRAKDWNLIDKVNVSIQDVHNLTFEDETFDLIISRGSIGFWKNLELAFKEIYRVLSPGGKTYIGTGLGNEETAKKIKIEMRKVNPDWPKCLEKKQKTMTTDEYRKMFDRLNFSYEILDNPSCGRWFIITKEEEK